jgi:hypothetical protein
MTFLIVAAWDGDNKITAENRAPDEATADAMVTSMVTEGYTNAFHVPLPSGSSDYWFVDAEAETVTTDQAQADADALTRNWKNSMAATDDIPRPTEDIYDALDEAAQARVPQITRDKITAKKTLRGEKP